MDETGTTATDLLLDNEYDGVIVLKDYSYDDALIGVSTDGQAIYDYDKMIDWIMRKNGWDYDTSVEWVDNNTVCTLPSNNNKYPIIMNKLYRGNEDD